MGHRKRGFDPAGDWLEDHGETMRRGNFLKVKATDLAESAPQVKGNQAAKRPGRINLRKVAEVLSDSGLDPTVEIVKILPELDSDLQAKVMLELIQYCQPKLKSVEVNATVTELTPEQRQARIDQLLKKGK